MFKIIKNHFDIQSKQRIYGLDILRASAISFVVIGHGLGLSGINISLKEHLGYCLLDGVSIFFVLSGYLIGGILIKKFINGIINFEEITNFWNRRWFRTLPNYFFVLIIISGLSIWGQIYKTPPQVWKFYIFLQNFSSIHPNFFLEAWSLSVEEWSYLLLPIFIFSLTYIFKIKVKLATALAAVTIILSSTIFRLYRFIGFPALSSYGWDDYFRKQVITRLDSIMFGVLGALLMYYNRESILKYKKVLFLIGITLMILDRMYFTFLVNKEFLMYQYVFSFSVSSISILFILPFLSEIKNGNGLLYKAVTHISLISYSMYLLNYSLILRFIFPLVSHLNIYSLTQVTSGIVGLFSFIILTIALSTVLFKYYEYPMTNLRGKKE